MSSFVLPETPDQLKEIHHDSKNSRHTRSRRQRHAWSRNAAGSGSASDRAQRQPGRSRGIPRQGAGAQPTADEAASTDQQIKSQLTSIAQDPSTAPDKLFILNSAIDSQCEVNLSQIAQSRSSDPQVQKLAARMIQDHDTLNQRLQQTGQELGVQVPQSVPSMKYQEAQIFSSLSGKTLDQQYLADMNASHAKAIACFEAASTLSQNPRVKQLATETLPTLHEHRRMVQQVASSMGINFRQGDEAMPAGAHMRGDNSANDSSANNSNPNNPGNQGNPIGATTPGSGYNNTSGVGSTAGNSPLGVHTTDKNGR